jgi:hypothetical protein
MREVILAILGLSIVALLAFNFYQNQRRFHEPLITSPYQRVVLQNGHVYYGRIDHLGTNYPVLRDALRVREEMDPVTREQRYALARRKDEAHAADHMIFPATSIAFVEPVRPDSVIGKLLQEAPGTR